MSFAAVGLIGFLRLGRVGEEIPLCLFGLEAPATAQGALAAERQAAEVAFSS
jgi:hypothetical protein